MNIDYIEFESPTHRRCLTWFLGAKHNILLPVVSLILREMRLTIETHVLSKGLGEQDVMALLDEVAHSPGIAVNISTRKALIGHIEENKQVSFL